MSLITKRYAFRNGNEAKSKPGHLYFLVPRRKDLVVKEKDVTERTHSDWGCSLYPFLLYIDNEVLVDWGTCIFKNSCAKV